MRNPLLFLSLAALLVALAPSAARAEDEAPEEGHAGPSAFLPGTPSFAELTAKAKETGKSILIDFSTEWCGWCKRLDADVFPRPEVIQALAAFVCAHLDAEKGEGEELAKRYGVRGFPTLVVIDAEGNEVDRIIGYRAPDEFVGEVARIVSGKDTLPALRKAVEADADDLVAALALAEREARSDRPRAERRLEGIVERAHAKADAEAEAKATLALGGMAAEARQVEKALGLFGRVLRDLSATQAAGTTARRMGTLLFAAKPAEAYDLLERARAAAKEAKDRLMANKLAYAWHQEQASQALLGWGTAAANDADALNEVAWTAYLQRIAPKASIAWARSAADLSKGSAPILDTLACLLFQDGEVEEAIRVEEQAYAKATDAAMKAEFAVNIAMWTAALQARKAPPAAAPAPPTAPLEPATPR